MPTQRTRAELRNLFDSDGIVTKQEWADVVASLWNLADDGSGGGTTLYSGDSSLTSNRTVTLDSKYLKFVNGVNSFFLIDVASGLYKIGDIDGSNGSCRMLIDDNAPKITFGVGGYSSLILDANGVTKIGDNAAVGNSTLFTVNDTTQTFKFSLAAVPNYADNAAAITGGLTAGMLYRTSAGGTSTLKIVQ